MSQTTMRTSQAAMGTASSNRQRLRYLIRQLRKAGDGINAFIDSTEGHAAGVSTFERLYEIVQEKGNGRRIAAGANGTVILIVREGRSVESYDLGPAAIRTF